MQIEVIHAAFEDQAEHMATVTADDRMGVMEALEYAYRWTNNVEGSWSRSDIEGNGDANDDVEVINPPAPGEYGYRSTSVGDYMKVDGTLYRVAMMGFEPAETIQVRKSI